jgi:hypothetical protein
MAYLSQVKAGGKQYIYLTEYCGKQDFTSKMERHVYGFGNSRLALLKMRRWARQFETEFPKELLTKGYSKNDLEEWIKTMERGITKTGRNFNVNLKKRAIN